MKTLVFDYSSNIIDKISGLHVVVRFSEVASFMHNYLSCQQHNHVDAFVLYLPLSSLSQIEINEVWHEIHTPLELIVYNLGDLNTIFQQLELLKQLEIRIYLASSFKGNYYGLKILSSLGIDCGLFIQPGKSIDDELLMDLASYYYLSPVPHAKIEPFDYISTRLTEEKNLSFNHVYYKDDSCYLLIDEDMKLYSSETGEYLCMLSEFNEEKEFDLRVSQKMDTYYSHFLNLDKCCKCKAFRICSGMMSDYLSCCEETMHSCLEDCLVFYNQQNKRTNDLCRH